MAPIPPREPAKTLQPAAPIAASITAPAGRRRRLWQLPRSAQETLLTWALPPERLREVAERTVSRLRRRPVALQGSEGELLACVLHDLDRRNELSEAVHDDLTRRHATAVARWPGRADPAVQDAAWRAAAPAERPGLLWAALTAPGGATREAHWLSEARACLAADARRGAAEAARAAAAEARIEVLDAALAEARARLAEVQAQLHRCRLDAQHEIAQLRGERDHWRGRWSEAAPLQAAPAAAATAVRPTRSEAFRPCALAPDRGVASVESRRQPPAEASRASPADRPDLSDSSVRVPPLCGRRVLCVGGMPGAHRRYQAVVEQAGARFAFHDGGVEHGVDRLVRQLAAADVVVCQSGCLNHDAYQRVKRHCQRAGTPCLFVERPSLTHFVRTLGLAPSPDRVEVPA